MSDLLAVLLFGPPGAGKGTQAAALAAASRMPHIATGDMFRENLKNHSELGQQARSYMDRGALVPDEVTIGMLVERIGEPDAERGFLLDGFPRNAVQARALDTMLGEQDARVAGVLSIEVPDDTLVERVAGRRTSRSSGKTYHVDLLPHEGPNGENGAGDLYQRDDDREDVVRHRLSVFHEQTAPVLDYYRALGTPIVTIDGARSRELVEADLLDALRSLAQRAPKAG